MSWAPEPIWFSYQSIHVPLAGFFAVACYVFTALYLARRQLEAGRPSDVALDFIPYGIVGGVGGSRLGYFAFQIPDLFISGPISYLFHPGFSFHGGMLGVIASVVVFARVKRLPILSTLDAFVVPFAVGFLLMTIAGIFEIDAAGRATPAFWGIPFPLFDQGEIEPPGRVPVPHLLVLWAALVLCVLTLGKTVLKLSAKTQQRGAFAGLCFLMLGAGRLPLDRLTDYSHGMSPRLAEALALVVDGVLVALGTKMLLFGAKPREREVQKEQQAF